MKAYSTLIKGARLIVEQSFDVQEGDAVLIICDDDHQREAQALAGVAYDRGAYPVVADVSHHVASALASLDAAMEPANNLAAAMKESDAVIITANLEWANRFAHVNAVSECVINGAKIGSIEEGMADWTLTEEDIEEIVGRADRLIEAMEDAEWVRVTNPSGTDVNVYIKDRPPLRVVPIKRAGEMMGPVPLWGEVAYAATEDKTRGTIVFDGVMLGVGVSGSLVDPIQLEVENGRAVRVEGGAEAASLRETFENGDENVNVVAEFAIGTSDKEKFGSPSEKGMLGTVHFGLGDNHNCYPGGQSVSRLHLDGSIRDVTVEVDGRVIVQDGDVVV